MSATSERIPPGLAGRLGDREVVRWVCDRLRSLRRHRLLAEAGELEAVFDPEGLGLAIERAGLLELTQLCEAVSPARFEPVAERLAAKWDGSDGSARVGILGILARVRPDAAVALLERASKGKDPASLSRWDLRGMAKAAGVLEPARARPWLVALFRMLGTHPARLSALPLQELVAAASTCPDPEVEGGLVELLARILPDRDPEPALDAFRGLFGEAPLAGALLDVTDGDEATELAALEPFFRPGLPLSELEAVLREEKPGRVEDLVPIGPGRPDLAALRTRVVEALDRRSRGPTGCYEPVFRAAWLLETQRGPEVRGDALGLEKALALLAMELAEHPWRTQLSRGLCERDPGDLVAGIRARMEADGCEWGVGHMAWLAGELRLAALAPDLVGALAADFDRVAEQVNAALARLGNPVEPLLLAGFEDREESAQHAAAGVLALVGGEATRRFVAAQLVDRPRVGGWVLSELANGLPDPRYLPLMGRFIKGKRRDPELVDAYVTVGLLVGEAPPGFAEVRAEQQDREEDFFRSTVALFDREDGESDRAPALEIEMDPSDLDEVRFDPDPAPAEPQGQKVPKIGRNEPCPCGSGRKYKKCCLESGSRPGP